MKRIFIAIPVYQYPTPECMESVINLISVFRNKYDITIRLISGYTTDVARTNAVKEFLENSHAEYMLFLDSDVIITEDVLDKLVQADKPIITAVYHHKTTLVQKSVIYKIVDNTKFEPYETSEIPQGIFSPIACGFGCVLIKRDLLRNIWNSTNGIPFKFVQGNPFISEDIYFCNEVSKLGEKIYCDGTAVCGHVGKYLY